MAQKVAPMICRCAMLALLFCILVHAFYAYLLMQDTALPYRIACGLSKTNIHPFFDPQNFGCKRGEYISMHYDGGGGGTAMTANGKSSDIEIGKCICNPHINSVLPNTTGSHVVEWMAMKSTFVILILILIVETMPFCRQCFRSERRCRKVTWCRSQKSNDEEVHREFVRAQCQYAHKCIRVAKVVLLACLSLIILRFNFVQYPLTVVGPQPPTSRDGLAPPGNRLYTNLRQDLIGSELLPMLLACVVFVFLSRMKDESVASWLDWANVAFSVMWVWRFCTLSAKWYTYYQIPSWACRIIQGIIFGNCRLTLVLQLFITIVDILCSSALGLLRSQDKGETTDNDTFGYALLQAVILGFVFCILWSFEHLRQSEAEQLVKAKRSDQASVLAYRLLSVMSDAVVHLDINLLITKPCAQLAGLMLRSSTGVEMVGQRFVDLLAESDRERFERNILDMLARTDEGEGNDTAVVHAMHVHLSDASHTQFAIEVFAAFIPGVDGSNGYVIGIKEEEPVDKRTFLGLPKSGEGKGKDGKDDVVVIPESISLQFLPSESASCITMRCNKSGQSHSSFSSSWASGNSAKDSDSGKESGSNALADDDEEEGTTWVCVDVASDALEIVCCSFAFACMVKCPGYETTSLKDLIPEEKIVVVKSFLTASDRESGSMLRMTMKPKHRSLTGFSTALMLADNPESLLTNSDSKWPATAILTDVQYEAQSHSPKGEYPKTKGQLNLLVKVGSLKSDWAKANKCEKVYKRMVKDRKAFRNSLVNPEDLIDKLKACCAEWIKSEWQRPELPHDIGAFSLNDVFFDHNMGSSYTPRLAVAIKEFVQVVPEKVDKAQVILGIELRFERHHLQTRETKLSL